VWRELAAKEFEKSLSTAEKLESRLQINVNVEEDIVQIMLNST